MTYTRRDFFSRFGRSILSDAVRAAGSVQSAVTRQLLETPPEVRPLRQWLRPPGALPEPQFRAACTQCTDCQEACPYESIRRLGPEFGLNAGTPAIIPEESPCYLCEDMPCIPACEPAALVPVDRRHVTMGTAVIDLSECYAAQNQPCDYCFQRCPLKGEAISLNERHLPVIHQDACVGCGVCDYLCPPSAITIRPGF